MAVEKNDAVKALTNCFNTISDTIMSARKKFNTMSDEKVAEVAGKCIIICLASLVFCFLIVQSSVVSATVFTTFTLGAIASSIVYGVIKHRGPSSPADQIIDAAEKFVHNRVSNGAEEFKDFVENTTSAL